VAVALLTEATWSVWADLLLCVVTILVSIPYYDPAILPDRQPGVIDGVEDLVFTGLLFVAATLLGYAAFGWALTR
jgi:hypothetical protein